jgi:tetratricopeptide (TPR) repeat protein
MRASFAVLLASLVLAGPAAAEKLYFFPTGAEAGFSGLARQKIDEYYRTILSMSSRLAYISPEDARSVTAAKAQKDRTEPKFNPVLDEANNLLWKGKDTLRQKRYEDAIAPLQQALDIYIENYDILRDMDNLVDAQFNLALAFFRAGYSDNAEEILRSVISLRPELAIDRTSLPKGFAETFERQRARVLKRSSGPVNIQDTEGKSVDVYIDGVLRGKTPLTLKDMPFGVHYVQVFQPGYRSWGKRFKSPKPGKQKTLKVRLEVEHGAASTGPAIPSMGPSLREVASNGKYDETMRVEARAFATSIGAEFLLFGYLHKEGNEFQYNQFLYNVPQDSVVDAGFSLFAADLSDLQVKVLILEDQLYNGVKAVGSRPRVVGVPKVYRKEQEPAPIGPVVGIVTSPTGAGTGPTGTVTGPTGTVTSPVVRKNGSEPPKSRFKIIPYGKGGTGSTREPLKSGPAWYKNKWVWIGVGSAVVLAGAGVGTYFLLRESGDSPGYKATLTW